LEGIRRDNELKGKIFAWIMGAAVVTYLIFILCDLFLFLNFFQVSIGNSSTFKSLLEQIPSLRPF